MFISKEQVEALAKREIEKEEFRVAVDEAKERLKRKRGFWRKLRIAVFPYTLIKIGDK